MARRVEVVYQSDLSGADGAERVRFGLDGTDYEIDLTGQEHAALRDLLAQYLAAARRVSTARPQRPRSRVTRLESSSRTIRAWAQAHSIDVPARGRIPASVVARFNQAHNA